MEIYIPDSVTEIESSNFLLYSGYGNVKMNGVIKCYPNSCAHNYAVENGINYKLLTRYDASGDDILDANDLTVLKKYLLEGGTATYQADCNFDAEVNLLDLIKIKKHFASQT